MLICFSIRLCDQTNINCSFKCRHSFKEEERKNCLKNPIRNGRLIEDEGSKSIYLITKPINQQTFKLGPYGSTQILNIIS